MKKPAVDRLPTHDALPSRRPALTFHPLTFRRWADLVALFGPRGASAGCWCMWWRLPHAEWRQQKGAGNKRAFKKVVDQGPPPGVLAYAGAESVGWCAVAPRVAYPRLARSRVLVPLDDTPVWSVSCFFVARAWRRCGVTSGLLEAAARYARARGGRVLEAYPIDPKGATADAFVYTGLASTFEKAGFREVARRSATRPVMRRDLA